MIPKEDLLISFEKRSRRGAIIIAQQPPVTYEEAFAQVKRLQEMSEVKEEDKKGISSVTLNHHGKIYTFA